MYPTFTKSEAKAIVSLVIDIAVCDDNFDIKEQRYVLIIANRFGLNESDIQDAQALTPDVVCNTFSNMSIEKRKLGTAIVFTACMVDGQISNAERRLLNYISQNCDFVDPGSERPDVIASNWIEYR